MCYNEYRILKENKNEVSKIKISKILSDCRSVYKFKNINYIYLHNGKTIVNISGNEYAIDDTFDNVLLLIQNYKE